MANIKATIITIGDELLIGQTIDTNSAWIAQRLNGVGIKVHRRVAVADAADDITTALDEELQNAQIILITGGLGPTSDDITKPLLAKYFGGKMVIDEKVLEHIKGIFTRRNRPFLDVNMKQAEVPDTCRVMFNRMGTAPGMLFVKDEKIIVAMPGVPFEMMAIMEDEVMPYLQQHITSDAFLHRTIITAGEGESFIAERIKDLEAALPAHIKLAYLPGYGMVKLRLTGSSAMQDALEKELDLQQQLFAQRLENIVIALEDLAMEHIVANALMKNNATIGLAESCTGGAIGHCLTQVIGSSQYFYGSIVCYQNEIKEKLLGVKKETIDTYGAMSEQTAIEMAKGALAQLGTDYALSVTGLLSPVAGEEKVKVGTVWMAIANKDTVKTKAFLFHYDRQRNKEMAAQMGMLMIWKFINDKL